MEQRKPEEIALLIGTLLLGSGYEKILLELAAIKEKDFSDVGIDVKKDETVLGPLSRFEKAAWALALRIEEDFEAKFKELKQHVCPSCSTCDDPSMDNDPCRDLIARMALVEPLREAMWNSIRKRFGGSLPSIALRAGFVAAKCPCSIGIEIIKVHGGCSELGDMPGSIFTRVRPGHG